MKTKIYRITTFILACLMVFQIMPVHAFEGDAWTEFVSEEYKTESCTVSFFAEGQETEQIYTNTGTKIIRLPEAPEREGEIFAGWFVEGQELTTETVIVSDMDAFALYLASGEGTAGETDRIMDETAPYLEAVMDSDLDTDSAAYVDPETHEIGKPLMAFLADSVQVSVLYGSVPEGSGAAFTQYTKEETDELVTKYGLSGYRARSGSMTTGYIAFDVSILSPEGEKYKGDGLYEVSVELDFDIRDLLPAGARAENVNYLVYHILEEQGTAEELEASVEGRTVSFTTESFSPFVLQYTVDFHYEVNGKTYSFSIPGGGFVSLEHLAEVLELAKTGDASETGDENDGENAYYSLDSVSLNKVEVSEETKAFLADVASVAFSSPELVWAGKVNADTTIGGLKGANGLAVQYSMELTEEQISEINSSIVVAGDWVLVSLLPFTSEESLMVTMNNGDQFVVQVTDAQISTHVITADGTDYIITITYGEEAGIPDGSVLKADEILMETSEYADYIELTREAIREKRKLEGVTGAEESFQIGFARFFDITIWNGTQKVEPETPVQVSIEYADALSLDEDLIAIHFADLGTELIQTRTISDETTTVLFKQGSFSVTGTVSVTSRSRWPNAAGDYLLIVNTGNSGYYAVSQNGNLYPVTYNEGTKKVIFDDNFNDFEDVDGFIWELKINDSNYKLYNTKGSYIAPQNGSIMTTSSGYNLGLNDGYITIGSSTNRYYLSLDLSRNTIKSAKVNFYNNSYNYSDNPATVYFVPTISLVNDDGKSQFSGKDYDRQYLDNWYESLSTRTPPLSDLDKTAEVYDYENRIYQLKLKAASGLQTFANDVDLSFMMDFSNSMLFAPDLYATSYATVLRQENLVSLENQGRIDPDKIYYVVADLAGTATHYAVYKYDFESDPTADKNNTNVKSKLQSYDGKWVYWDASFYAKTRAGICGYSSIASDGKWRIPTVLPSGNGNVRLDTIDGNNVTYQLYTADDAYFAGITYDAIYSVNGVGGNRLYYLKEGVKNAIKDLISIALKDSAMELETKTVRIAYNQFWATVGAEQDFLEVTNRTGDANNYEELIRTLGQGKTDGGTRHDYAMTAALDHFDWSSTATKYAILITDGAPLQNNMSTNELNNKLIEAANRMKDAGITLITVGVSMSDVANGNYILNQIASKGPDGVPYFYEASNAEDLTYILNDILRTVMAEAVVNGDVEDVIDEAFYPVDPDGTPLKDGDLIDMDGNRTEDTSKPYGVISQSDGVFSVKWSNQDIPWDGWTGSVYVKAKEDFLGGNAIHTNKDDATFVAQSYVVTGKNSDGEAISSQIDMSEIPLAKRSYTVPTPYVNVDELALTETDTAWTVYLGTEVNPKDQLERLIRNIDIRKVVSGDLNEMITSKDQMLGGTGESSKTMKLTDYLGLSTDAEIGELIEELLSSGSKTYAYNDDMLSAYEQGYVGDIVVSLVDESGCYAKDSHSTETVGKDAEFTLKVEYQPRTNNERNNELSITNDDYHNGDAGPGTHVSWNEMVSNNHHEIRVFVKKIQVEKKDKDTGTRITAMPAEFTLYSSSSENAPETALDIVDENGIVSAGYTAVAVLKTNTSDDTVEEDFYGITDAYEVLLLKYGMFDDETDMTTTYYLVETKPPAGYKRSSEVWRAILTISEDPTGDTGAGIVGSAVPYNWTQAALLTLENMTTGNNSDTEAISFTVENERGIPIEILKVDDKNMPLDQAIFHLQIMNNGTYQNIKSIQEEESDSYIYSDVGGLDEDSSFTSGTQKVTITNLPDGQYKLIENRTKDGYIIRQSEILFSIEEGVIEGTDVEGVVTFEIAGDDTLALITVVNEPGAVLPNTGGSGTKFIGLIGFVLMGFAGTGLVLQRRRRRKNAA